MRKPIYNKGFLIFTVKVKYLSKDEFRRKEELKLFSLFSSITIC